MKNAILKTLMLTLFAITSVPCISQFTLSDLSTLSDPANISDPSNLSSLLRQNPAALGQLRSGATNSQFDYIGYTFAWDFQTAQYDTASREELVSEVIDGKTNWVNTSEAYNDTTGTYEMSVKVEYYNVRIPSDPDEIEDETYVIADSLLIYVYDNVAQEYVLFVSQYIYANKNGKVDYSVGTIYLFGQPFSIAVLKNYYDEEGRLIARNTESSGFGGDSRDSITFIYNGMDQLEREVLLSYDSYYTGVYSSSIKDYSYYGDGSLDFTTIRLYSDSLMTLGGIDSIANTYHSPDSYTSSFYYYESSADSFVLGYYWDHMNTGNKQIEAQYQEGGYGIYNAQYIETTFDECERAVEGLSIVGNSDGTEESRERFITFYRKEPSCSVSTKEAESKEKGFTYSNDGQELTVHFDQFDQGTISMFSVDGRTVGYTKYDGVNAEINIAQLTSGIYYVAVSGTRTHGVIGVFIK